MPWRLIGAEVEVRVYARTVAVVYGGHVVARQESLSTHKKGSDQGELIGALLSCGRGPDADVDRTFTPYGRMPMGSGCLWPRSPLLHR